MRNSSYYKSVVIEFFPKETDKYRDAVLSQAAAQGKTTDDKLHDCCCNRCGDNINSRAEALAEVRFN